jgi:hypothetical protein
MSTVTAELRQPTVVSPDLDSARGQVARLARHLGVAVILVLVLAWSLVAYSSLVFGLQDIGERAAAAESKPATTLIDREAASTGP